VRVIHATPITFANTLRPTTSMNEDADLIMTSYGPVTPAAIVAPAIADTAFAALADFPTSV